MAIKLPSNRNIRQYPQIIHEGLSPKTIKNEEEKLGRSLTQQELKALEKKHGGWISSQSEAAVGIKWEGQHGPRDLRNKKIEAHDRYAKDLQQIIDLNMEIIFAYLKQMRDALNEDLTKSPTRKDTNWAAPILMNTGNRIFVQIDRIRAKTFQLTKTYIETQKIGTFPNAIKLADFCYDGDHNKFKQRVLDIFARYAAQLRIEKTSRPDTMMYSLFGLMFRIADTESMYIANHLLALASKGEAQFGEYVSGENCISKDPVGVCDQYCNGIHTLATLHRKIPPFHPNCHCFAVYYTIDELNDSNKEEKEE